VQEGDEVIVDVERLRRLPLFGELDHHDLAIVAHHVREARASQGEVLFEEGAIPYELLVIEEGTAEIVKDGVTIGSIGPGDVVGEMGLLRQQRRMATVRATSPLRAVAVAADDLAAIETEMPEIAAELGEIVRTRSERPSGPR
jgi:CRP/FNR family transcriptional regulator, cyclic AMP receptor protein